MKIGTVTFTEAREITHHHTATACNYRLVEIPTGTYDVMMDDRGDVTVRVTDAVQTYEYIVNRLFTASSVDESHDRKPTSYTFRCYNYEALRAACDHKPRLFGGDFRLLPGVSVVVQHITLPATGDRHYTRHTLSIPESAE